MYISTEYFICCRHAGPAGFNTLLLRTQTDISGQHSTVKPVSVNFQSGNRTSSWTMLVTKVFSITFSLYTRETSW